MSDLNALKTEFDRNGFTIVRGFLRPDDARIMRDRLDDDRVIAANAYEKEDASGRKSRVTLWYEPGDDIYGRLSCSDRMITTMSHLLEGDACFFHAKLMQKQPHDGGAWEWHQDYGYWYDDGFLHDSMASCYVALDAATRSNGCLELIPGSHHYGRLRHGGIGEQVGADPARVAVLEEKHGRCFCELDAGDAVFFHSNTLHCSAANRSDRSRWGLISSFFRDDNQSCLDDPRFHRKAIRQIPHNTIMKGSEAAQSAKAYL